MSENPPRRWFQCKLSGMLGATFWLCVSFAFFGINRSYPADDNPPMFFALIATMVLSPFIAAGTLFGHPARGLLVGIALVCAYVMAVYVAISRGWIPFP